MALKTLHNNFNNILILKYISSNELLSQNENIYMSIWRCLPIVNKRLCHIHVITINDIVELVMYTLIQNQIQCWISFKCQQTDINHIYESTLSLYIHMFKPRCRLYDLMIFLKVVFCGCMINMLIKNSELYGVLNIE